jgi:hypothetical protein
MAVDDRDPKFERALARELRGDSAQAGCPDAETLAAYHERSLSLEEMAHWKQHISGCALCQEALSLVEVTEKELAEDWEQQGIPVLEAAAVAPHAAIRAVPKGDILRSVASSANAAPVMMAQRRRPKLAKWAIPLGALAAGALIAIGIYQQRAALSPASKNVQVAVNQPQAVPPPSQNEAEAYTAAPVERDARRAQQAQLDDETKRKEGGELPKEMTAPKLAPPVSTDTLRKDMREAKKQAPGNLVGGAIGSAGAAPSSPPPPAPSVPAKTERLGAATESVEVATETPATPSAQSAPTGVGTGSGAGGGGRADDQKLAAANKEKSSVQQESAELSTNAMLMKKQGVSSQSIQILAESPGVILTPDNKAWWRLTADGTVELTTDSGKKWKSVSTGASAQLTAGSAPSGKVCWIAGKAGTLVLTTDRGGHWKKLATPIAGDLGGVHASDAKHATIWDAVSRQSFETSDAGETWKPVANE